MIKTTIRQMYIDDAVLMQIEHEGGYQLYEKGNIKQINNYKPKKLLARLLECLRKYYEANVQDMREATGD